MPPAPRRRPTIADVARRAGVSAAAVSFAVNDRPGVSPETRERILAAAREEPRTAAVVPLRRRWLFPATAVAAVAAACAAIGLGLWANSLRNEPTQRVVALQGAPGNLIVNDDRATLVVCLDEAPSSKTYEAWVVQTQRPRAAGLFAGGCSSFPLDEPVEPGDVVAVTLEPAGGSDEPTSEILASANV
jgi:anti-sigma-K factor RskA